MCNGYFAWFLVAINLGSIAWFIRGTWLLGKEKAVLNKYRVNWQSIIDEAGALRAQARAERDKWKIANMISGCNEQTGAVLMTEWQPIETAPKDRDILVYEDGWCVVVSWEECDGVGYKGPNGHWMSNACVDSYTEVEPTHWQPLPEPPK